MAHTKIHYSTRSVLFSILFVTFLFLLSSCDSDEGPTSTVNSLLKITAISPDSGFIGDAVRISGSGFVPQASQNKVTFGGMIAVVQPDGPRSLLTHVPKGAQSGRVKLTVAGQTVTGPYFKVLIHGPSITSVSPLKGPAGTQVTILGNHFLPGAVTKTSGGNEPPKVITGIADSRSGTNGKPQSHTITKLPSKRVVIDAPQSVAGSNSTSSKLTITVTVSGVLAPILSISGTKIIIEIPEGAGNGPIIVSVGGQSDSWTNFQVIAAPVITSMTPKQGPAETTVTLKGTGFSSTPDSNMATFNSAKAAIQSASTTKLVVMVPSGATSGLVKVITHGMIASGPTFTVTKASAPQVTITGITPKDGSIGTSVAITGTNFSTDKTKNTVTFNGTPATVSNATKTQLKVTVPSKATTGPVKVKVDNQTATGPTFTVTKTRVPQVSITDIAPKSGPVGTPVTISGTNFSMTKTDNTVTFNGTPAKVTSASATELEVTVPTNATTGVVKVKVGGQTAAGPTFTVTINHPPLFTGTKTAFSVDENTTPIVTLVATDPDGDALVYSFSGGVDANKFTIGSTSGKLAFLAAPDFESPTDTNRDNIYQVQMQTGDGTLTNTRMLTITVDNVSEAPEFRSAAITVGTKTYPANGSNGSFTFNTVPGGSDLSGGALTIKVDHSVDPITQVTFSGADAGGFSVKSNNGYTLILTGPVLDYEHSASHQYRFNVTMQNGTGQKETWAFTIPVQNPFAAGSGTASDPYQVATLGQLQRVGQFLDRYFIQIADIDASHTASWLGGKGFAPIGNSSSKFTGTYNGSGYTIYGLTIDRPGSNYIGLFGVVGTGGALQAVQLKDVNITGSGYVGGLVGGNDGGNITNSYAAGSVTGNDHVGGLVGINYASGSINSSYATGNVTNNFTSIDFVGGLVGQNSGTITHSYATGTVTGNYTGGLVARNYGTITESYWDKQSTGQSTSAGSPNSHGLTTAQMQGDNAPTNMIGFDFTTTDGDAAVWKPVSGGYPILQWQP